MIAAIIGAAICALIVLISVRLAFTLVLHDEPLFLILYYMLAFIFVSGAAAICFVEFLKEVL